MLRLISAAPELTLNLTPEWSLLKGTRYITATSAQNDKRLILELTPANPCCYLLFPENNLHPLVVSQLIAKQLSVSRRENYHTSILTYSEHVLNAVRLAVVREVISHKEVEIHYYTLEGLRVPKIYKCGGIDLWPEGFFDQSEISLDELVSVRTLSINS